MQGTAAATRLLFLEELLVNNPCHKFCLCKLNFLEFTPAVTHEAKSGSESWVPLCLGLLLRSDAFSLKPYQSQGGEIRGGKEVSLPDFFFLLGLFKIIIS